MLSVSALHQMGTGRCRVLMCLDSVSRRRGRMDQAAGTAADASTPGQTAPLSLATYRVARGESAVIYARSELFEADTGTQVVVRELWAYQLAISPIPPAPGSSTRPNSPQRDSAGPGEKADDKQDDKNDDTGSESGSDTSREKEDDKLDDDVLEEISERSDISEDEDGDGTRDDPAGQGRGPVWRRRRPLRASDTLVTLITALWILRVPVLNIDIQT